MVNTLQFYCTLPLKNKPLAKQLEKVTLLSQSMNLSPFNINAHSFLLDTQLFHRSRNGFVHLQREFALTCCIFLKNLCMRFLTGRTIRLQYQQNFCPLVHSEVSYNRLVISIK